MCGCRHCNISRGKRSILPNWLYVSKSVEFQNKMSALYSAKNIGFNYECVLASGCNMTITICHFNWESETFMSIH